MVKFEFRDVGQFLRRGETAGVPEKNLSEQGREPTTNSTHTWRRRHRCATLAPQEPKLPTVARLTQLDKRRSTEREAAGSSPGRTNTRGL